MEIETRKVTDLKLDPSNARKHSEKNLDAIRNSLKLFGQRKPIVIIGDGTVLAGNGTLEAAKSLGWKELAVTVAPADWDSSTAKAYALADNKTAELAEWDSSILVSQIIELNTEGWNVDLLGFDTLKTEPEKTAPADFQEFGQDIETSHQCPKCGYEWA
jgi:ParB-like chromosome segregation protein Spo0J